MNTRATRLGKPVPAKHTTTASSLETEGLTASSISVADAQPFITPDDVRELDDLMQWIQRSNLEVDKLIVEFEQHLESSE
jgi:hypothetical protein